MPFAPTSLLLLVVMPGATSSVLAPECKTQFHLLRAPQCLHASKVVSSLMTWCLYKAQPNQPILRLHYIYPAPKQDFGGSSEASGSCSQMHQVYRILDLAGGVLVCLQTWWLELSLKQGDQLTKTITLPMALRSNRCLNNLDFPRLAWGSKLIKQTRKKRKKGLWTVVEFP